MKRDLLRNHIAAFLAGIKKDPDKYKADAKERQDMIEAYQAQTEEKILQMTSDALYGYFSPLWAMRIWGNKRYVVDKLIEENGLEALRSHLASLVWGKSPVAERWDEFRRNVKGVGPAMMSEILCKVHSDRCMLWNRRAYVGLNYLGVEGLPRYDYQLTGAVYTRLSKATQEICAALKEAGLKDTTLLSADYFIWEELQVEDNLSKMHKKKPDLEARPEVADEGKFIHNDVRDKLRDIGQWLGFVASIERKVSEGSKVDTTWEATIGNMGRVIYVFEVQTKGSIDSLIINLLKSLNNPAVQGVVAVSDRDQLEKIKAHVMGVSGLRDKLKYWDYEEVLRVHENLEYVNDCINTLGLVPQGF